MEKVYVVHIEYSEPYSDVTHNTIHPTIFRNKEEAEESSNYWNQLNSYNNCYVEECDLK